MTAAPAVPRATYRLQLGPDLGFDDAAGLAPYLARLGVSHLYASPYLQAAPGSPHGYDVVDPTLVNVELGGEEGRARLVEALRREGLGHVLDIVPNHMATRAENPFWWDLLESGPWSDAARMFDVDWDAPEERVRGKVLVPVLGDHYGRVLEAGELMLEREGGSLRVRYHDHVLPLAPETTGRILGDLAEATMAERPGSDGGGWTELVAVARELRTLPRVADASGRRRRARDLAAVRGRLVALLEGPNVAAAVDRRLAELSRDTDALDRILSEQHHRLAWWRAGARELDYRRFFDIDTLAGVRVEDPEIFEITHGRILEWLQDGSLDGVRVDHPDGLRRPRAYLERLRERAPQAWIVVEKILEGEEALRPSWPVDGTTGYDAARDVLALFIDPAAERPLTDLFTDVTGQPSDWEAVAYARKHQVLREILASDLNVLAHLFLRVCEGRRRYRDFTRWELREALREALAPFPVYRTYVEEDGTSDAEDRAVIGGSLARARAGRPDLDPESFDLLEAVLLGDASGEAETELRMRFQQLTGPVMAKAVEDTAFYAWPRFVALNEVGSDPGFFGADPARFHARCATRVARQPAGMTTLSTHDTKRSEDVRARLALLSEIPGEWSASVRSWIRMNVRHRRGPDLPDPAAEYLLYQTLVGAFPLPVERAMPYMEKASREAKARTSWTDPVPEYDDALRGFVEGVLADEDFRDSLRGFAAPLVGAGRINALSQKLVQLTMPGVPDVYQGTELWDLSLVDPDNRRPVDFDARQGLLEELEAREAEPAPERGPLPVLEEVRLRSEEGLPKLWLVRQSLALRRRRPQAFG
ncbi:MAG: malto-oligosyltrehalose synthase, partial [Gemmatimonadetes bacterium]|nr:malto-oligosyltrehalose synthase [Gemmatimonadota bacterium]